MAHGSITFDRSTMELFFQATPWSDKERARAEEFFQAVFREQYFSAAVQIYSLLMRGMKCSGNSNNFRAFWGAHNNDMFRLIKQWADRPPSEREADRAQFEALEREYGIRTE